MKRFVSILAVFALVLSLVPAAFAEDREGDQQPAADPAPISDQADGGVENNYALLSALINGDVVDACTCSAYCQQVLAEFHIVH